MKTIKKQYSKNLIMILLAINWAVMILLTSYFMGENGDSKSVIWTLSQLALCYKWGSYVIN